MHVPLLCNLVISGGAPGRGSPPGGGGARGGGAPGGGGGLNGIGAPTLKESGADRRGGTDGHGPANVSTASTSRALNVAITGCLKYPPMQNSRKSLR